jgi:thioredoxin 1
MIERGRAPQGVAPGEAFFEEGEMSDHVGKATDADFQESVVDSEIPVLVDFWAPWCGPCRAVGPILEDLAEQYAGRIKVVKVNVDENQQVAGSMGIRSIPTVVLYNGGQVVETVIGLRPKEQFVSLVEKVLGA